MKIRWKVLILLLVIALGPLVVAQVIHQWSAYRLGRNLAALQRQALIDRTVGRAVSGRGLRADRLPRPADAGDGAAHTGVRDRAASGRTAPGSAAAQAVPVDGL